VNLGRINLENPASNIMKRSITTVLILFILVIVYFSGPSTAFQASGYPTMAHQPGTKDINVSITFFKERYEAIGTLNAVLMRLPPNPSTADTTAFQTTPWVYETVGANDYNCWAAPYADQSTDASGNLVPNTSFYSYDLNAYYTPNAPVGPWQKGTGMDLNFDIFAYGYMWDPSDISNVATGTGGASRAPGDANFVYKFMDWSNDMGFSYTDTGGNQTGSIATAVAQFGYYGYGYNYAGKFTCVFHFRSVPEGIYLAVVPYINGLKVGASGWDSGGAGVTPEGSRSGSIIAIKDVNTQTSNCGTSNVLCSTDLNFVEPNGTKRISFTVPRAATDAASATVITIDVNSDGISPPSGVDLDMGKSTRPPRFTFGADVSNISLSSPATLRLYWSGILTTAQATAIMDKMVMYQYNPSNQGWTKLSTTVNMDQNKLEVTVTGFV